MVSFRKMVGCIAAGSLLISSMAIAGPRSPEVSQASYVQPAQVANMGPAVIAADDTVDIAVFQIPDLSRTVQVDSAGRILLPLIGQVEAAGLTAEQLSDRIAQALNKKYVRDAQVTVTLKDSTSQKVTVDGAVNQPGIYPLTGPTTLMQAVALAKGTDPKQANTRRVSIFRMNNGARVATVYDLASIRNGKSPDPAVYPRDVVVVATSSGKTFMGNLGNVLPVVSLLRPW